MERFCLAMSNKPFEEPSDSLHYEFQPGNPVDCGFKWILVLGRFIGVSPLSISLKPKGGGILTFRWRSLSTLHSLFLGSLGFTLLGPQLWACVLAIGSKSTILEEMLSLQGPGFQLSVAFAATYLLRGAPRLIHIFHKWSATVTKLNLTSRDSSFPKFCLKISIIVLGMGITENILWDIYSIKKKASSLKGDSLIGKLYQTGGREFANYVPHYSPFISAFFLYATKFGTYSWNFGDILLIILCRALSHKFRQINEEIHSTLCEFLKNENLVLEQTKQKVVAPTAPMTMSEQQQHQEGAVEIYFLEPGIGPGSQRKQTLWKGIRDKILALCELAEEVTSFVAPLVLACCGYNLFCIIVNSLSFLYDSDRDITAYVYVSTIQFAMRVVLVTYHAAQVYHSTDEVFKSMERFPDSLFSPTAYRLERMLARHPVGVAIFGGVLITRKFFISILSFLFTTEIVLLQAMSAAKTKTGEGTLASISTYNRTG